MVAPLTFPLLGSFRSRRKRIDVLIVGLGLAVGFLTDVGKAEAHIEADGFVVTSNGLPVVHVWQGTVSGSFVVPFGASTGRLDVEFLDPDSTLFTPGPAGQTWLKYLNENPGAVAIDSLGAWAFGLRGLQNGGAGNIRLRVWFQDHYDFTSPRLPFQVLSAADAQDPLGAPTTLGAVPNPVRGPGFVRFDLPNPEHVVLTLHSANGRFVRRLADGPATMGPHLVSLESQSLEAGVYFLRLQTSSRTFQGKIQVVK